MGLTLKNLLLDGADRQKAVDEALLLLAVAPHAGHGLLVVCRIPVCNKIAKRNGVDVNTIVRLGQVA